MSRVVQDFTDLLLKSGVVSLDQLTEAEEVAKTTNANIGDVLVQMEYATSEEVKDINLIGSGNTACDGRQDR